MEDMREFALRDRRVDLIAGHRDRGLGGMRTSRLCGELPSHRCTVFELTTAHDPMISATHLLMRTILRDRLSGAIVASRRDICKALPLEKLPAIRQVYVSEMCQMIAPHVRLHALTLADLRPAIEAMNDSWDFLGVFKALEEIGEGVRLRNLGAAVAPGHDDAQPSADSLSLVDHSAADRRALFQLATSEWPDQLPPQGFPGLPGRLGLSGPDPDRDIAPG